MITVLDQKCHLFNFILQMLKRNWVHLAEKYSQSGAKIPAIFLS